MLNIIDPVRFAYAENFLPTETHEALLRHVEMNEPRFSSSSVSTGDVSYRKSRVLHAYDFPDLAEAVMARVRECASAVTTKLRIVPAVFSQIECQLTASGNGDFFKVHNDSGSPDVVERTLTYVYYFFREPKAFSGGALRIYDSLTDTESFRQITPKNNSIVFFPSYCYHEVMLVEAPDDFMASRFTVNGWLRSGGTPHQQ